MMDHEPLDSLVERTRRVYRPPSASLTEGPPAGFVEALRRARHGRSEARFQGRLQLWERLSYAGAAIALTAVFIVHLSTEREDLTMGNAGDPWMAFPMNSEFAE